MAMRRCVQVVLLAVTAFGAARIATAGDGAGPGRFAVGVTELTFTKTSVTTGAPRPLRTVIWYPAVPGTGTSDVTGRRDADVAPGAFPLIVYSHGSCGRPSEASYLTVAMASRGFVVAAPPHPGDTSDDFPLCLSPGETVDTAVNRVPDVSFVIDSMLAAAGDPASRFDGRLRADAISIAGVSFGGYTTLAAAQFEPRLRAALALVPGGTAFLGPTDITIPTMVIGAEHDHVVGFAESPAAYNRVAGPRFLVELFAADHLSVVDSCKPLCGPADISQDVAHRLVLHYALPFLRHYLAQGRGGRAGLIRPVPGTALTADDRGGSRAAP